MEKSQESDSPEKCTPLVTAFIDDEGEVCIQEIFGTRTEALALLAALVDYGKKRIAEESKRIREGYMTYRFVIREAEGKNGP